MVSPMLVTICLAAQPGAAKENHIEFFENQVRPLLVQNCYECHSRQATKIQGGLLLDSRAGWMAGGRSGVVIRPGEPERSLLIQAVRYEHDRIKMPPQKKLPARDVERLVEWVRMGAADPREGPALQPARDALSIAGGRDFWAFKPPRSPTPPRIEGTTWPWTDIDRFVLSRMQQSSLTPVGDADVLSLLRRVTFDLTGLPPRPEVIADFKQDFSADAWEGVVDRLLASPHFGERWGRHWLDVVRYADSLGSTTNVLLQQAWRYRDYVIRSFNHDKPYDQFVREQLAGDLLPAATQAEREEKLLATGFLALSVANLAEPDPTVYHWEVIAEQLDTMGRAFLALTIGCARCHDHKFAPIPTRDYYALGGILESSEVFAGHNQLRLGNPYIYLRNDRLIALGGAHEQEQLEGLTATLKEIDDKIIALNQIKSDFQAGLDPPDFDREKIDAEINKNTKLWKDLNREYEKTHQLAMGVRDRSSVGNAQIRIQGLAHSLGSEVPRGFLQVLDPEGAPSPGIDSTESGRRQLAEWFTRRQNPLIARVLVNRIWHHLFGRGLLRTVDNFGPSGERPSHPELLDYLAVDFMENGWSVKRLIRKILLSRVYQLSTAHHPGNYERDPQNLLLWRTAPRRLEIEALRDAMLSVSGNLESRPPEPVPATDSNDLGRGKGYWGKQFNSGYRTLYVPVLRRLLPPMFEVFDFPPPEEVKGARDVTTVPTQALFLMNSAFVSAQAKAAAKKLLMGEPDEHRRASRVFLETVGRKPTDSEIERTTRYVRTAVTRGLPELDAWKDVYHAQFACAGFLYRN